MVEGEAELFPVSIWLGDPASLAAEVPAMLNWGMVKEHHTGWKRSDELTSRESGV